MCGGQKTTLKSILSFHLGVPGIKHASGLVASVFTPKPSLAPSRVLCRCFLLPPAFLPVEEGDPSGGKKLSEPVRAYLSEVFMQRCSGTLKPRSPGLWPPPSLCD